MVITAWHWKKWMGFMSCMDLRSIFSLRRYLSCCGFLVVQPKQSHQPRLHSPIAPAGPSVSGLVQVVNSVLAEFWSWVLNNCFLPRSSVFCYLLSRVFPCKCLYVQKCQEKLCVISGKSRTRQLTIHRLYCLFSSVFVGRRLNSFFFPIHPV